VDTRSGLACVENAVAHERLAQLRQAIRNRQVSFPAQVPSFPRQHSADNQWRIVTLYFVRGWTPEELADRYRVTPSRIRQLLRLWVECARALGYLQEIPAEEMATSETQKATAA